MPGENLPAGQKPAGKPKGSQQAAGEQTGKTAGGEKSAGTNEPQKGETGNQKEARELGSDRPQRPAKGADYFDYEGGKRGSFRSFFKKASKHFEGLEKSGQIAKGPHTDPKVLDMNAEEFIRSKPNLRQQWDSMSEKIEERMAALRKNSSNYSRDPRYKELGELNDELAKFGRGKLGEKRPDLVELLLNRDKVVVTDITQKSGDAFHEFKTKVYKNLLQDLFPALEAEGVEYKGPSAQEIF